MNKDIMVDDMSIGMTIDAQATEEEVDSLGIMTTNSIDPFSVSLVIKRDTGMQTIHIKT